VIDSNELYDAGMTELRAQLTFFGEWFARRRALMIEIAWK